MSNISGIERYGEIVIVRTVEIGAYCWRPLMF